MPSTPTTKTKRKTSVAGPRIRPVPAVTRALAILRLLGSTPSPLGVSAVAESLGLVRSTCLHILRVLVGEHLVRFDPVSKRYSLGVGMLTLARSVVKNASFASLAQPALDRISKDYGVTTVAVETSGFQHNVCVAISRAEVPFRLQADVGTRFPLLISASGRCVAASGDLSPAEIKRRFKALIWQSPPKYRQWCKEVDDTRRNAYSIDRGNYIAGVTVVAVPILGSERGMRRTLSALGVSEHFQGGREVDLALDMRAEAQKLSAILYSSK